MGDAHSGGSWSPVPGSAVWFLTRGRKLSDRGAGFSWQEGATLLFLLSW